MRDHDDREDMQLVLAHYGRDVDLGSGWKTISCPFHSDGNEKHPSARACLSAFTCNSCGVQGDSVAVIMEVEKCDVARAFKVLEGIVGRTYGGVSKTTARKSWGVDPFSEGSDERDDRALPPGVRKLPDLWT